MAAQPLGRYLEQHSRPARGPHEASGEAHDQVLREGFGSLRDEFADCIGELRYDLHDISQGIDRLRSDFHILMGDVIWKLEIQNVQMASILAVIQAPLDAAAKELRRRGENAYHNGWYEEALKDLREAAQKNYQDFAVHRTIANIYLYHLVDLTQAREYFLKAAKYAQPRDVRQCSEALYFAAIVSGLQQDFTTGLAYMREAATLNQEFLDAHYMQASFAGLLMISRLLPALYVELLTVTHVIMNAAATTPVSTRFDLKSRNSLKH